RARLGRDGCVGHRPAGSDPVRRDRARTGDAVAQRHGDGTGRDGDGLAVYAGDDHYSTIGAARHEAAAEMRTHHPTRSRREGESGYTFVEMLVVATIILILASGIMMIVATTSISTKVTSQRAREAELRRALREMRTAIDKF